jgi:hypothetical protein
MGRRPMSLLFQSSKESKICLTKTGRGVLPVFVRPSQDLAPKPREQGIIPYFERNIAGSDEGQLVARSLPLTGRAIHRCWPLGDRDLRHHLDN